MYNVEALKKEKTGEQDKRVSYQKQINKAYNKKVNPPLLCVGDLVLKTAYVQKGLDASKFAPKW